MLCCTWLMVKFGWYKRVYDQLQNSKQITCKHIQICYQNNFIEQRFCKDLESVDKLANSVNSKNSQAALLLKYLM